MQQSISSREADTHVSRLIERGFTHSENKEYSKALKTYNEALEAAGDNNARLRAEIYYRIGRVNLKLQRYNNSLVAFQDALTLVKKAGTRLDEAKVHNGIGNAYQNLGQISSARNHYLQALKIRRENGDKFDEVQILINIGSTYLAQGKYAQTREYYEKAKSLTETAVPKNLRNNGAVLSRLGMLYAELGQYDKALTFHKQALIMYKDDHYLPGIALAMDNIGYIHSELLNYTEAIASYKQSVTLKENIKDRLGRAVTLNNLGLTLSDDGQTTEALRFLEEALLELKELNAIHNIAATLDSIGSVYKKFGEYTRALDYFNQSLVIFRQLGDRNGERISLGNIGAVLELQKKIGPAIIFYKMSVNITQAIRKELENLPKKEQRAYAQRIEKNYRRLANLLIDQGRLLEAEEVLAMLKEEEYFEFMRRRRDAADAATTTATLSTIEGKWVERYADINQNLITIGQEYEELRGRRFEELSDEEMLRFEQLKTDMETARQAFRTYLKELEAAFLAQGPQRAMEFGAKELKTLKQVQAELKKLGSGSILITILVTDDRLRLLLTTSSQQVHRDSRITWQELNHLIAGFRITLQNPSRDPFPQAKMLYKYLIAPLEKDLQQAGARTLLLSLDDTLRYLPFAALYDGEQYLSQRYGLVVYTAAARSHLTARPQSVWRVTGLGVSEGSGQEFGPLPAVPRELNFIVREERQDDLQGVLPGVVRLNSDFTIDQLSNDLRAGYPVVHIASHFKFKPGNEDNSFLLLGSNQKLTLAHLLDGDFPLTDVDLLALSACETAYGERDSHGKEIESFGVLAQQQGAKAVLATLWPVDDTSTAEFMAAFYQRHQEGVTKAEALRMTQETFLQGGIMESKINDVNSEARTAEVLDATESGEASAAVQSYTHPYYWAPFILMGNFL